MSCKHCAGRTLDDCKDWYLWDGECATIKFCPMCGDALTDPAPLTLEELREMDGEPAWISKLDKWGILGGKLVDVAEGETEYRMVIGFEYGWEWLDDVLRDGRCAYTQKPKDREG